MSDAQHTPESIGEAIRPTLEAFAAAAEPTCRRVADEIYAQFLHAVQDYLRENGEWNIGQEIARCRRIEADNYRLEATNKQLLSALKEMVYETTHLSPEEPDGAHWCRIPKEALDAARAAIAAATHPSDEGEQS
jgi:hypothetical protein